MQRLTFEIDVPSGALPESLKEQFQREVMVAAVLNLLRRHAISQGRAAQLLRVSRTELLELMARCDIPAMDVTDEDLAAEARQLRSDSEEQQAE